MSAAIFWVTLALSAVLFAVEALVVVVAVVLLVVLAAAS